MTEDKLQDTTLEGFIFEELEEEETNDENKEQGADDQRTG